MSELKILVPVEVEPKAGTLEALKAKIEALKPVVKVDVNMGDVIDATKKQSDATTKNLKKTQAQIKAQTDLLRLEHLRVSNSKGFKETGTANTIAIYDSIHAGLKAAAENGGDTSLLLSNMRLLKAQITAAGNASMTFGDKFKGALAKFGNWFGASQAFMAAVRGGKQMVATVKEVNAAMTDLKKVSDESDASYGGYLKSAAQRSVDMSTKLTDYIGGTTEFSRLGYDIGEAKQLGEVALIYKNVGDGIASIEDASGSIISTMKAFNIEAKDAMGIVDVFNKLGNTYAVSSGDIGAMLTRSAAALAAAGNSLEETAAMGTAMAEINQDAEKSGAALKILSLRLRGAKTDLESMGEETDGMVESTSKLRDEIKALTGGFDIMKDDNTFKSTYEQMQGIANAWQTMDKNSTNAAALLELIAGKNRSSDVAGLLSNWATAEKALVDAQSSSGSAMQEYSKWEKELEAKSAKLASTAEQFSVALVDDGAVGAVYDGLTGALNVMTQLVDGVGSLSVAFGAAALAAQKMGLSQGISIVKYAPPREIPWAA